MWQEETIVQRGKFIWTYWNALLWKKKTLWLVVLFKTDLFFLSLFSLVTLKAQRSCSYMNMKLLYRYFWVTIKYLIIILQFPLKCPKNSREKTQGLLNATNCCQTRSFLVNSWILRKVPLPCPSATASAAVHGWARRMLSTGTEWWVWNEYRQY